MKKILAIALLVITPASAQTATEQAMGARIMQEVQAGLACSVSLLMVQADLAKAQARIRELESKPEPKKD